MELASRSGHAPRAIIPWLFPAGLGLVFAVNMVLLWLALGTFPGRVTANAYEEGRQYDRVLAREAAIAALGWEAAVRFIAQDGGVIEARYTDRHGMPVTGLAARAILRRPVGDPVRLHAELREAGPGVYRGMVELPHRGLWHVQVVAEGGGVSHEMAERINVP